MDCDSGSAGPLTLGVIDFSFAAAAREMKYVMHVMHVHVRILPEVRGFPYIGLVSRFRYCSQLLSPDLKHLEHLKHLRQAALFYIL